ncbi:MAG TPA: sterol desaturase family protein, partial [Candidatus Binataceae bacterium]
HAVFTIGAWIPVAVVWATFFALFGARAPTIFFSGIAGGFAIYEAIHYRLHFSSSLSGFEQVLRTRHLAHHYRAPDAIFGVTNSFWDRLLGSQPDAFRMQELQDAVAAVKPLQGPSNIRRIFFFGLAAR